MYWRTYWKGWLEHQPLVWHHYRLALGERFAQLNDNATAMAHYQGAIDGMTGIEAFDSWAQELVAYNYLHNHARMWFASIWIFTLKLPWELGADFFMQHLLDGDPASNTLSWRWVAGLQTKGKNYVARADNIARYTADRFSPAQGLNERAEPLEDPAPQLLAEKLGDTISPAYLQHIDESELLQALAQTDRNGMRWLVHEDDLHPESLVGFSDSIQQGKVKAIAILQAPSGRAAYGVAPAVAAAVESALQSTAERLRNATSFAVTEVTPATLRHWLAENDAPVFTPYAPVGPIQTLLAEVSGLVAVRRAYDVSAWPYCRRGFFKLKKQIPELLAQLG